VHSRDDIERMMNLPFVVVVKGGRKLIINRRGKAVNTAV
jgi:hypothetical protein